MSNMPVKTDTQIGRALVSDFVTVAQPQDVVNAVHQAVLRSYIDTGVAQPNANNPTERMLFDKLINDLTHYIRTRLKPMHVNEIGVAIYNGSMGDYGQYYGLNQKSYIMFLNAYMDSEARKKETEKLKPMELPPAPPSKEERFEMGKELVMQAYAVYNTDKPLERTGVLCYDFLDKCKLFTYTTEQKIEAMELALPIVTKEKAMPAGDTMLSALIKRFSLGVEKGTPTHTEVANKAKYLLLNRWFADNTNVGELIDSKKEFYLNLPQ